MPRASAATSRSLSAYARQFLEMMQKPDVDQIDGLSPAISIEQKTTSQNPRSTVGTVTEIYDYMRLLWARVGVPYSPATGLPIESQTVSQMVDRILALPEGTRLYLLAPVVRGRKGEYRKELAEFQKKGYQRVKIDGEFYEIAEAPALDKKFKHDIDVVVDRIVVRADIATRLADSLEQALKLADGLADRRDSADGAAVEPAPRPTSSATTTAERLIFSEKFACPVSGFTIPEIEPRLFSFNNPFGACPACDGLGVEQQIDADLVVPDHDATLRKGAIAPWAKIVVALLHRRRWTALGKHYKFTLDTQWKELPKKTQEAILYGSGDDEITLRLRRRHAQPTQTKKPFEGVITNLERRCKETESDWAREELGRYFTDIPCDACNGARLKPEALCVKIAGKHIGEVADMSVKARAASGSPSCRSTLTPKQNEIAVPRPQGDPRAAEFLVDVGLDYLTLVARLRHAVRRREPAHPPRLADRLRPHRRALRARRAVDRPAPARQRAAARDAAAPARPRQHRDRGRARRGRDPRRRLRDRHRPRRRHPRRRDRRRRARPTTSWRLEDSLTGKYLSGALRIPMPRAPPRSGRRSAQGRQRRAATTSRTSPPRSRSACSPASPASPAAASRRC